MHRGNFLSLHQLAIAHLLAVRVCFRIARGLHPCLTFFTYWAMLICLTVETRGWGHTSGRGGRLAPVGLAPLQSRRAAVTMVDPGGLLSPDDLAPPPPVSAGPSTDEGGVVGAVASMNRSTGESPSCGGGFGAIGEVAGL